MIRGPRRQRDGLHVFRIGSDDDPDVRFAPAWTDPVEATPPTLRGCRLFERLVAPRAPTRFLAAVWEQRATRLRDPKRRRWARSLLGSDGIERLLERRELPATAVRVVLPSGASRRLTRAAEITSDLHASGRALVVEDLHLHAPDVRDVCIELSNELGIPVRASATLLPPRVELVATSSPHARFVMQLEGASRMTLDEGGARRSLRSTPSDVVYLPSAVRHGLRSGAESSLSLAFEIHELSAFDVMKRLGEDALARCSEDLTFRRSCSTTGDPWTGDDRAYLDDCFRRFRAAFRLDDLDDVREDLYLSSDASASAAAGARFSYGQLLAKLGPSTRLERRPALFFARRADPHLILKLAGKKLLFPIRIAEAFDFVTTANRFALGDIPGLDASGRIVLARRLLREGFLFVPNP